MITYRQAGVDIDAGDALVERIKPFAKSTRTAEVVEDVGGFAGLIAMPNGIEDPLLVSGTDGVGTKLKVAFATHRHDTIGQDLVAMCVNDVITTGARPLFFLDYFGCGKLDIDVAEQVISGIAAGCRQAGCALLGGETAELPGMYPEGEYDLAGFCVGVVGRKALLGPARVKRGDRLLAIASSGLHSNGYSLARHVLEQELGLTNSSQLSMLGVSVADALLTPTRIYARAVRELVAMLGHDLHALCHVTGGGVPGNLPRVLPRGLKAVVHHARPWPALFELLAEGGPIEDSEMRRTFNLGVGMVAIVSAEHVNSALRVLNGAGERAWEFGDVAPCTADAEPFVDFT